MGQIFEPTTQVYMPLKAEWEGGEQAKRQESFSVSTNARRVSRTSRGTSTASTASTDTFKARTSKSADFC